MFGLRWSSSRAVLSFGLAAILSILGAGVAAADSTHGQSGHHTFVDSDPQHTSVTCVYTGPDIKLTSLIVKPPKVWWPDTNSSNTHQHGTVGWRAFVQKSTNAGASWTTTKQTSVQKKVAYEDQTVPYDESKKAPFTKTTISWNSPHTPLTYVRVIVQAIWYHRDGTVMGWWKHPHLWYHYTYHANSGAFMNACNNYGTGG